MLTVPPSPFRSRLKSLSVAAEGPKRKYGCLMAVLPKETSQAIVSWVKENIDPKHLTKEGWEGRPHVTIKYGFVDDIDDQIVDAVSVFQPFEITLQTLSLFKHNEDGDVLKVDVRGPLLWDINQFVSKAFRCYDKYPVYRPHLTLAYLDPNYSSAYTYAKPPILNETILITELQYSNQDRSKQINIDLARNQKALSWLSSGSGAELVRPAKFPKPLTVTQSPFKRKYLEWSIKAGFTGQKTDKRGRKICYQEGRRVSCNKPSEGGGSKPPGGKPGAKPKKDKITPENAKQRIADMIKEGKVSPQDAADLASFLNDLTVVQLNALKKELGLIAKGKKAELAKQLAERALNQAKTEPADKPTEPPASKGELDKEPGQPLEEYLKQDRPDDPVAKRIRDNKEAVDRVKSIAGLYDKIDPKYKESLELIEQAKAAWAAYSKVISSFDEKNASHVRLRREWSQLYNKSLNNKAEEVVAEGREELRKALVNELRVENPPKLGQVNHPGFAPNETEGQSIRTGSGFVSAVTNWEGGNVDVTYTQRSPRAYFTVIDRREESPHPLRFRRVLGHKVKQTTGKPEINIGNLANAESGASTVAHELGHMVETLKPGVFDDVMDFVKYRVGDEVEVDMGTIPGGEMMRGEMVRKDKFDRSMDPVSAHYVGKIYKNKDGSSRATEIMSMGVQKLFDDPVGFCRKDPEYAAFVISMLRK